MIEIRRTDASDEDFFKLVTLLDTELAERDGTEHAYYAQFNKIDSIRHVVIACVGGRSVSCGAIKHFGLKTMEIKRMFTIPDHRGNGIAAMVLDELEKWALELSCTRCVLETGKKQPEAIRLYTKCGYSLIPNYGQYAEMENSVCFAKEIVI